MEAAAVPLWSTRRAREVAVVAALAGMVAASALIVAGAESRLSVLVPSAKHRYPGWLRGPLSGASLGIDAHQLAWLLVAMCACYLLVLALADAVDARVAIAFVMAGVYLAVAGRERIGGAAMIAASAIKLPTGLPLLFAVAGLRTRRRELLTGAVVALAAVALLAVAAFGHRATGFLDTIRSQENQVAFYSVPNQIGRALGLGGATKGVRYVADAGLIAVLVIAVRAALRGTFWVTAAGWTMFALLL